MYPLDAILQEYNVTRYTFQKKFNYSKNRFYNLVDRNTPVDNLQVDIIHDMSICFNISMDEVYKKLKTYEQETQH
ncbi:MAG: hypothetical protein NC310_00345 [Roseburia sp.]|nr:hypothetical protein [Anaeroplasma bactoclasticum]MCM1195502.1 hypothetical protein [Roseburia sp.]MCM1556880.1 hypothetical protein [Anaeroplasma bactoclasticum]